MTLQVSFDDRMALACLLKTDPVAVYGRVCGAPWGGGLATWIPAHMHEAMVRYIIFGTLPGSFLRAILTNDYMLACRKADPENRQRLCHYALFLIHHAPSASYGAPAQMTQWARQGGILGHPTTRHAPC